MGIFDFFKSNGQSNAPAPQKAPERNTSPDLNLRKEQAIQTLNLRKESVTISLRKNNLDNIVSRVGVVMDDSGSMENLYSRGIVQETVERFLPIGLKLDDNAELDMWLFSHVFKRLPSITEVDFFDYVNRVAMKQASWGGTKYAPIINDIVRKYVTEEPSNIPTLIIFVTDGENTDEAEAERALREASKHNIFFQFVGIGNQRFSFLKELDDLSGREVDNANFFQVKDISKMSDEELYGKLMNEYPMWLKEAKNKGILN